MSGASVMIIPAAGKGTRLQASVPKVLAPVNGKAMIDHLLDLYSPTIARFVIVLHPEFEPIVQQHCANRAVDILYARQETPTGMLDAILAPLEQMCAANVDCIWISWCDQVGIHPATVATLRKMTTDSVIPALVFPTAPQRPPYIHLVRDPSGRIVEIKQRREGDAMPDVGESDMGLFALSRDAYLVHLREFSEKVGQAAGTKERNFLPFIPWLTGRGFDVRTFPCRDEQEAIGVNTIEERRVVERYLAERVRARVADA